MVIKWSTNRIKDLCENIFSGGTPDTRKPEYWNGNLNWLSSGETRNKFIESTEKKITQVGVKNSSTRLAKKYDIVMACAGQGHTRGQTSLILSDTYVNQSIIVLRTKKSMLYPFFLFYNLRSKYQFLRDFSSSNSIRGSITCPMLGNLEINFPKLTEQEKISQILLNYDSLIENNTKRIELLEKITKLIYDEWFVKFKFPGHEKVKMVYNDKLKREIPEVWEVKTIGESFKVILGGTPARAKPEYWGGDVNWINSGKVNELRIINNSEGITELGLKKSATKLMPSRTTVLAITGATLGQISLTEIEVCANQSVVGIYDDNKLYSEYIFLKIKEIINKMIMSAGGGAQQHINKEVVNQTEILIPKKEVISDFNNIIIPIFNEISNLLFKNQNLRKTRDLLLPKLINGEVDVSHLDIKVPEVEA